MPQSLWVSLVPNEDLASADVALVVDVIRATTTAVAFLEAGAKALLLAASLEEALALKAPGRLLSGEVGGLRPEGFDLGNSPREALSAAVQGSEVVMATTNGTRAAHRAARGMQEVLLASLWNLSAAARLAVRLRPRTIAFLPAGKEGKPGLDDLYVVGRLAQVLVEQGFLPEGDGAQVALHLAQHPPEGIIFRAEAALALEKVGLFEDVPVCAQVDRSSKVPRLVNRRELRFEGVEA